MLTCAADRLPQASIPCELIFLDPPYGKGLGNTAVLAAQAAGWMTDDTLVVLEDSTPQTVAGFVQEDVRRYGDTHITFLSPQ